MKYWEVIADNLSKAGWSWDCIATVDREGRTQHVCEVRPRRALPLGRALRILIGLALIAYVTPVFFRVPLRFTGKVFLLVLGLIGLFSLLHIVVSRCIVGFGPSLGAVVAAGLLVALYVVGTHGSLIFGHGEGALAVITFLGISLVVADVRAALGCEVTAIPSLLLRKHTELACLIFSPLDTLSGSCGASAKPSRSLRNDIN